MPGPCQVSSAVSCGSPLPPPLEVVVLLFSPQEGVNGRVSAPPHACSPPEPAPNPPSEGTFLAEVPSGVCREEMKLVAWLGRDGGVGVGPWGLRALLRAQALELGPEGGQRLCPRGVMETRAQPPCDRKGSWWREELGSGLRGHV